jgi:hypothetical protein
MHKCPSRWLEDSMSIGHVNAFCHLMSPPLPGRVADLLWPHPYPFAGEFEGYEPTLVVAFLAIKYARTLLSTAQCFSALSDATSLKVTKLSAQTWWSKLKIYQKEVSLTGAGSNPTNSPAKG